MHSLVRRYVKTAIAFLLVGLAIGGWMVVRRELWLRAAAARAARGVRAAEHGGLPLAGAGSVAAPATSGR